MVSAQATPAGAIRGVVKSGNMPIPGATVTASNTLTGQKVTTWSDVDGSYSLRVPANGRYVVRAQMSAFAASTQEVLINTASNQAQADLELVLQSRAEQQAARQEQQMAALGGRGFQSLQVTQNQDFTAAENSSGQGEGSTSMAGAEVSAATESVAISGNTGNYSNLASMSSDAWRQRISEFHDQQGGPGSVVVAGTAGGAGGPGGGGGGLGGPGGFGGPGGGFGGGGFGGGSPGFSSGGGGGRGGMFLGGGGRNRFNINRPHGTLYYSAGDDALDAAPYSLSGEPVTKPGYIQQRFGVAVGGPLAIPKLFNAGNKTFFFLNYGGTRGENPYDQYSTVPTLAERGGDFSNAIVTSGPNAGAPVQIYDPSTGQQFQGNAIPSGQISQAATGLLAYIPLPNVPGTDFKNFHYITSANNSSDNLNFRLNRSFGSAQAGPRRGSFGRGSRNNLSIGVHYRGSNSTLTNPFPSVAGSTDIRAFDVPVAYVRSFGKLTNVARAEFSRQRIRTQNLYAFTQNVTGDLGINGVSQNPFDWGLPGLSFTNFSSLQDENPALQRNQTLSFSEAMILNRGRHTWRWGGDFRRMQINTETDSNARGSFVFTGLNTSQMVGGQPVAGTGYDFADFLLGLPQQTAVQFGENNYHFRANFWDAYVQDEWRLRGNLTLNLGVRYEYMSPFSETGNHLANLDVTPEFTAAAVVLPGQAGPYSGTYPSTLLEPDRNNFAPRIGIAWKAFSKTVVRAGYGINYNTTAYQAIVQQLAFQPPFSTTQTNIQAATGDLTLQNGFPATTSGEITNNYGIDKNYRLGYLQIWNVNIQQELRPTLLLNVDYTGTKGTRLDILTAPNRDVNGTRIPGVQPFTWADSLGDSTMHAGTVRLRKRLSGGVSVGGTYTYSKSIDNASSIGSGALAGSALVAQNAFDLAAERGLSSFDQRHRFTGDYLIELPFGKDRRWLRNSSPMQFILGDWSWSGSWTIASGLPFTPRVLGDFADVSRGTNGTIRADVVPGQAVGLSNPTIGEWFNTAAFVAPADGQLGDARRNSIEGPGSLSFNMALTKVFPVSEGQFLEVRAQAANVFNTPQYATIDTIVNSPTFGQVISVGAMRTIQLSARYRF